MPRLLVTGVSGYLGSVLAEHAAAAGWEVVGTFRTHAPEAGIGAPAPAPAVRAAALDVRAAAAVSALVAAAAPDAIVHTAYVQDGPDARPVNVDGAANVARAARAAGARLVHLSSDVVFRGTDDGRSLREDDPPDPVTAYGATKADGERAVAAADPGAVLVRTSLIYGGPRRAPSRHEQLAVAAARGELDMAFFTDETRNPVQVDDLAAALLELAARPDPAGPLHVAGADTVSRLAFARLIAIARGEDPARLQGRPSPPDRPGACPLDSSRAQGLLRTRLRGVRAALAPAPSRTAHPGR